ncbi:hypothetical protein [Noviherbaspirillum galbum]|uniref:Uncharacterized protein n=1 Tax=Noviherbaspirillum galbum TaxID=2709383 RepID=A0A6B3SWF1_9BURK|nr:hypothetical protein [Noviherbaspirillum galbum]NEX63755.1 hypothetical protein [Noviherbaspirillum galbum]
MNTSDIPYRMSSHERRQVRARAQKEHFKNRLRARKEFESKRQRVIARSALFFGLLATVVAVSLMKLA